MYKSKIFFPPILQSKHINEFSRFENIHLVHFNFKVQLNDNKKLIDLFYSNVTVGYNFVENTMTLEKFIENYEDKYSKIEDLDLAIIRKFTIHSPETISFELDFDYCNELFNKHKRKLVRLMKKEIKRK
jgi:hypothetical protein